jgi:site-specific recombinase XerC
VAGRPRPAGDPDELSRHAISAWLAELAETCEPSTVATRLRGMRRFCRWLVSEGELDKAPTDGIEIASAPDKPVPILTDEEITALLKTCAVGRGAPASSPDRSSSHDATRRFCGCCWTPASASPSCAA